MNSMLPDHILDVLQLNTTKKVPPLFKMHVLIDKVGNLVPPLNNHRLLIPEPRIQWVQTCKLVEKAFFNFDAEIGNRIAGILSENDRLHLTKVESGQAGGYCAPPDWQGAVKAEIHYSYEETINDVIYLAHELGHLLASDLAQENGYKGKKTWMPKHMAEIPAMFFQYVIYDYLVKHQDDPLLQQAARKHFIGEVVRGLYELQVAYANPADGNVPAIQYERNIEKTLGEDWRYFLKARQRQLNTNDLHSHCSAAVIAFGLYFRCANEKPNVFKALFSQGCESDISEILYAAGAVTDDQLGCLLSEAVDEIAEPLKAIHTEAGLGSKNDNI